AVPVDRRPQARGEVAVDRLPAELLPQLRPVDRVPEVVTRPVGDVVVGVARLPHRLEDLLDDVLVVPLPVGADEVRLADATALEDREDGPRVVVGVDPVADVLTAAVELRSLAAQ